MACFPIKEVGACSPEGGDWRDSPTWKQVLGAEVSYVKDEKVILARIETLPFTLSPSLYYPVEKYQPQALYLLAFLVMK